MVDLNEAIKNIKNINNLVTILNSYGVYLNKNNMANCPFHEGDNDPSFSVDKDNKVGYYKCFGCGESGDMFSFIMAQENTDFMSALIKAYEILGIPLDIEIKGKIDKRTKLKNYIKKNDYYNIDGHYIENIFIYDVDELIPSFLKIKYRSLTDKSKKDMRTYKVIDKGDYYTIGTTKKYGELEYTIYNYPRVKKAIEKDYPIYFVEGEKDADNLNRLGLTATTIYAKTKDEKVWDVYKKQLAGSKIVFIGDTGEAGEEFKNNVWNNLKDVVQSFKVVNLPEIEDLGDNKDVTDWLEAGHTKDDLINAVNRSLDLLNEDELQQDDFGIHYIWYKEEGKGEEKVITRMKTYLTDFNILGAKISRNIDTNDQDIELTVKNHFGKATIIKANARTLFTDLKTFRTALGVDYNFTGGKNELKQLIRLKQWIVKYFIKKDIENYKITGIRKINNEYVLVTNNGILYKDGKWDTTIKANNILHDIDFADIDPMTKEEAEKLAEYLFYFNTDTVTYNTLGCAISHMVNTYARESTKDNLPVLFDIGESNAGKTKAQNIIKLLYNNTKGSQGFNVTSAWAIQNAMGETYLPIFVDEIKPSKDGTNKKKQLGQLIRTATEDHFNLKGTKSQKYKTYETYSTLILTGEDGTDETAAINRTNTVRYSRINFSEIGKDSINFLCNSSEGQLLLRKFSRHLYLHVLNNWNPKILEQRYEDVKNNVEYDLSKLKDDRIQKTAIYTILGLEIIRDTFLSLDVDLLYYGFTTENASELVIDNLIEELNDGLEETLAEYEKILQDIDHIAGNVDIGIKIKADFDYRDIDENNLALILPSVWDKLERYYKTNKSGSIPLDKNLFTKTLRCSKYFVDYKPVKFTSFVESKDGNLYATKKAKRAFILNKEALKGLQFENLIEEEQPKDGKVIQIRPEYIQEDFNQNPF